MVDAAAVELGRWEAGARGGPDSLGKAAEACAWAVRELVGFAGLRVLLERAADMRAAVRRLGDAIRGFEGVLDREAASFGPEDVERLNADLTRLKDSHFTLRADRLGNLDRVRALAGQSRDAGVLRAAYDLNVALNGLERLEVRGRDSAGIHVLARGRFEGVLTELADELDRRLHIEHFTHGAVRRLRGGEGLSLVYKVAAEVGELGDNIRFLREELCRDELLRRVAGAAGAELIVVGHTRWASIGVIHEANAHPVNQEEGEPSGGPDWVAALNGDVDNFRDLTAEEGLRLPAPVTTDAKVIPVLLSRACAGGQDPAEAFRRVVNRFEGSVAVAAQTAAAPDHLYLALRGSGQALYVGLAAGTYVVASEPYGFVEEASTYLRLDGATPADPARPASPGQ
ncbi:MAG: glucosamine-6-phosphate synthase, partial [Planctomycetota bacterium]